WLGKMFFWHGLDMPRDLGHFRGQTLGNMGAPANTDLSEVLQTPTIDEVIAYSPSFYDNSSFRRRCLALSTTRSNGGSLCFGYTDPTTRSGDIVLRSLISSPLELFNELFDSGNTDGTQTNTTLVDQVYADYQSLRNHQRIGAQDKQRLEAHLNRLQELQNRMTAFSGSCGELVAPGEFPAMNELDAAGQAEFYHIYNRVIVAAIACDSCRVFSLSTPVANGSGSGDAQDTTTWHGWSHKFNEYQPELIAQNAWINEHIFLDLVQQLDAVDEGNGTALDNSLVMRTDAHSFTVHCVTNLYALCAGGLGGYFKTDRYIDFRDQNIIDSGLIAGNKPGFLYNQFLANILLAMGVPKEEFESYNRPGQKGYGDHTFLLREGPGSNKDIYRRDRYLSHMDKLSDVLPLVRG
ncbi:MAG: DUF1552 domain-containing protein, partial [Myxococcota bacterium]|nr:DUF1552 domain-containing protein [Myxococcota bacterium]